MPPSLVPCSLCPHSMTEAPNGLCSSCSLKSAPKASKPKVEMKQTVLEQCPKPATPANPEQTIAITSGLSASDTKYDSVPVSKVEEYLKGTWNPPGVGRTGKRKDCYERTQPIQSEPTRKLNRVYVDIDGEMPSDISEDDFNGKVKAICDLLKAKEGRAVKESCKWKCADESGSVSNKLSFTIHYQKLCGTKKAIAFYVKTKVAPKLKLLFKDVIPVLTILKKESKTKAGTKYDGHLIIDLSVFNEGQRKMRMLGQTKPCQDRPYRLVSGSFEDTLITYIPLGCAVLPEPQSILTLAPVVEAEPTPDVEESIAPTEVSDPTEEDLKSKELINEVLGALGQHRWDYYPDWLRIGFVMYNEGFSLENFTDLSKRSKHWKPFESIAWVKRKWSMFRKSNMTQVLLWKWLSEDNPEVYSELILQRNDFWALVKNPSHAEVARFFYNLKPDAYLFNEKLGWFQLLNNNIWKAYEKQPNGLLPDIWHSLKKVVNEHKGQIDLTETDEDKAKAQMKKMMMLLKFCSQIGNKGFCDGVIAFLPSCYNDDELDKKMDESRNLLAFSDAVYDFDTMEVRAIKPDDFICLNTGFSYPVKRFPEARKELIETIRSVFEEQTEIDANPEVLGALTSYVLKTLAMTLHGRTKYEKFFVWTGTGGNGKGLIAELVKRVLGDYYHTVPHQVLTKGQDKKDATCPPLAKAKGKRGVFASEPEADDKLQVGAIKEWTGGDPVSARDLYRSTVSFVPLFFLFLQTNNIPQLNRPDGGIQRRLEVVRFPFQFVDVVSEEHHKKINIDLKEKIIKSIEWRNEMWFLLLEAYQLLVSDGLAVPGCVVEQSSEYMDAQNPIKEWLENNYTTGLNRNDRRFYMESSLMLKHYLAMNPHTQMDSGKFKASMEALKIPMKKESHDFTCMRYVSEKVGDEWVAEWRSADAKAGKYWCGVKKAKAPMPLDFTD